MCKVLFFDVDGTLIDYNGEMPASTKLALELARQKGHQIVVCSGRAKFQLDKDLLGLCDGLIGTTGANVEYQGKTIYEHFLSSSDIDKIKDVLKQAKAKVAWMSEKRMYMNEECLTYLKAKFLKISGKDRTEEIIGDVIITDQIEESYNIKKVLYHDSDWTISEVATALEDICDVTASSFEKPETDSGEITCKGINKSLGIQKYIDFQGIEKENTIAFGDGPNDMDMILFVHTGVVMGNGREDLKKVADFITKRVDEDGIFYALETLKLI